MAKRVRNFNLLPDGSTVELSVETNDTAWAASTRILVTNESPRTFSFSATSKGPKGFQLDSPKVALGEWRVTFLGKAKVKLWTRTRRPNGTIHSSSSHEMSGKAGDVKNQAFVVTSG